MNEDHHSLNETDQFIFFLFFLSIYIRLACRIVACNEYSLYLSNLIGKCDVIDVCDLIDFWMSIFIRKHKRLTFSHFLSFSLFLYTREKNEREREREGEEKNRGCCSQKERKLTTKQANTCNCS
jgi:hypothetical protein